MEVGTDPTDMTIPADNHDFSYDSGHWWPVSRNATIRDILAERD